MSAWQDFESLLLKHFHNPDLEAIKIVLSAVAAHRITDHDPVWLMQVAPPGSMKTVVLEALTRLPSYFLIDQVSTNTFISGMIHEGRKKKVQPSLLHRIGKDGLIAIPDFSTILSMHETKRDDIFAQMRRIYDGSLCREFGTDEKQEERQWRGRITMLTAVTAEIDHYHRMTSALGDRFLKVRWERAAGIDTVLMATRQPKSLKHALREHLLAILGPVFAQPSISPPVIPEALEIRLAATSEYVCLARAHVHRTDGEIDEIPQPESNTRLAQQLFQVVRGWTVISGAQVATEESFELAHRLALDCVPPARLLVLRRLQRGEPLSTVLSTASLQRVRQDLVAVGLLMLADGTRLSPLTETLIHQSQHGKQNIVTIK